MEVTYGESKRLSELFLLKSILLENPCINRQFSTLIKSVHVVMLDSGFVMLDYNHGSGKFSYSFNKTKKFSYSKKLRLASLRKKISLRYTLPELITLKDTDKIESVIVTFRELDYTVLVYGIVGGSSSSRCKIVIDKCRFLPAINLVKVTYLKSDILSTYQEVFVFWTMVKDVIVIPLLLDLYDKAGLEYPPSLLSLPTELKLEIIESLPGTSVAMMACVCTEMRYLASDNDLWKHKCLEEYKYVVDDQPGSESIDWKPTFVGFTQFTKWLCSGRKTRAINE